MAAADAYPFPTLNAPVRFSVAIAAVALVFLVARTFEGLVDEGSRLLLLGMAVMAGAWFAGTGPALAATVTGALLGAADAGIGDDRNPAVQAQLALFVLQGLLLTAMVSELRLARRSAEQQAQEARVARRETEAAGRMKDEFLATISHELRTPLNAVLGWVHMLRTGKLDAPTATRALASIERNSRLQAQLTGNLLDISKALTGRLHVESQPVSLTDIVRQVALSAGPASQAKGVQIANDVPQESIAVLGDWSRLRQVVWHLLANALKFTPRGGTIGVVLRRERAHACLKVYDSGPGIDPAFLPRIFERFTQEDSSPSRAAGGLGVGLSLVRELVELHGGDISAANREGAPGAVFTTRFPLQPATSLQAPGGLRAAIPVSNNAPVLDGLRVLVLDHDDDGRELVETVLRHGGALVRATGSVADALEWLETWRPDVLVSDGTSPEHDSYALVGKILSLEVERGGRIPALALTRVARTDPRMREMLASAQSDLPKPFEPAVLTAEIARLAGRERRRVRR